MAGAGVGLGGEFTDFVWSQVMSSLFVEISERILFCWYYHDSLKEKFEKKYKYNFPEGEPPVSITDVGIRAKANFLWDPVVYGRCDANTIQLLEQQAQTVGASVASREAGGVPSHNGYAIPDRTTAEANFFRRFPNYKEYFRFPMDMVVIGNQPPGVADGQKPIGDGDGKESSSSSGVSGANIGLQSSGAMAASVAAGAASQDGALGAAMIAGTVVAGAGAALWGAVTDPASGKTYWYNKETKETTC